MAGRMTLSLKASVWRDGMPGSAEPGVLVNARIAAGRAFPEGVSLRIYVILGAEVWSTGVDDERPLDATILEGVSREGPRWPGGSSTDVVVRIDDAHGPSRYLAARNVPIEIAEGASEPASLLI